MSRIQRNYNTTGLDSSKMLPNSLPESPCCPQINWWVMVPESRFNFQPEAPSIPLQLLDKRRVSGSRPDHGVWLPGFSPQALGVCRVQGLDRYIDLQPPVIEPSGSPAAPGFLQPLDLQKLCQGTQRSDLLVSVRIVLIPGTAQRRTIILTLCICLLWRLDLNTLDLPAGCWAFSKARDPYSSEIPCGPWILWIISSSCCLKIP